MGVVSRRRVCLVGVVVRRYIDFLILLIPTPLVSALFLQQHPTFCSFKKKKICSFSNTFCNLFNTFFAQYKQI